MSDPDEKIIFIADNMLGSLARWLRMIGYDCRYEKELSDDDMIKIALEEKRMILTRDKNLADRGKGLYVNSTSLDDQLTEVKTAFNINFHEDSMRCSICNGRLFEVKAEDVKEQIPEKSLQQATSFWKCDGCQKIYWNGTHWNGIINRFKRLKLMEDKQ